MLRWNNSEVSREALGYTATRIRLEGLLVTCHPSNHPEIKARISDTRRGRGPTLFDEIIEIIHCHGPDGDEPEAGIILELL